MISVATAPAVAPNRKSMDPWRIVPSIKIRYHILTSMLLVSTNQRADDRRASGASHTLKTDDRIILYDANTRLYLDSAVGDGEHLGGNMPFPAVHP